MGLKDTLINLLLDSLKVPTETVVDLVEKADADEDGFISARELYDTYKRWRNAR